MAKEIESTVNSRRNAAIKNNDEERDIIEMTSTTPT